MGRRKKAWKRSTPVAAEPVEDAVARKDDEDLFFLDRAGKQDRKKRHKPKTSRSDLAEEQSRKQKGSKIVQLTSRTFYERRSLKRKKRQRGKATAELNDDDEEGIDSIPGVRKIPKRGEIPEDSVGMDIWGGGGGSAAKNTSKKRIKKAISEKSLAKSKYSKPLGAQSYNPLAEKQQELIQEASSKYERQLKEKARIKHELDPSNHDDLPYVDPWEYAYYGNEEEEEGEEEGALGSRPAVRAEDRLTRRQRRLKEARKAEDRAKRERERVLKKSKQDIHRIKGIVRSIVKEHKKAGRIRVERELQKEEDKKDPMKCKLGKERFKPEFPEVLLSDEVTGNLRDTVVSDNAVRNQFSRLQECKLIEPRKKKGKRKNRYKRKTVKLHKDLDF